MYVCMYVCTYVDMYVSEFLELHKYAHVRMTT